MSLWNCALHGVTGPQACCATAWRVDAVAAASPGAETPRAFEYLLNAMERAGQEVMPADHGYAEKRRAVFEYVASLTSQLTASRSRVSALEADAERMRAESDDWQRRAMEADTFSRDVRDRHNELWRESERLRERLKWAQVMGNHLGWGFDEAPVRYYVAAYTTSANGFTEEQVAKVYHDGTPASVAAAEAQAIDDAIAASRSAQQEGRAGGSAGGDGA